jgi:hypothetical protein
MGQVAQTQRNVQPDISEPIDSLRSTVDRNHGTRAVRGERPLWSKAWTAPVYPNTV